MESLYKLGLNPGILVGLIVLFLIVFSMLGATAVIFCRSRQAAHNKCTNPEKTFINTADLEASDESYSADKGRRQSMSGARHVPADVPNLSTVNVIITPSRPNRFKVETDNGGVEVRVTPPTPIVMAAKRTEHNVQYAEGGPRNPASSPDEPVWYIL